MVFRLCLKNTLPSRNLFGGGKARHPAGFHAGTRNFMRSRQVRRSKFCPHVPSGSAVAPVTVRPLVTTAAEIFRFPV